MLLTTWKNIKLKPKLESSQDNTLLLIRPRITCPIFVGQSIMVVLSVWFALKT